MSDSDADEATAAGLSVIEEYSAMGLETEDEHRLVLESLRTNTDEARSRSRSRERAVECTGEMREATSTDVTDVYLLSASGEQVRGVTKVAFRDAVLAAYQHQHPMNPIIKYGVWLETGQEEGGLGLHLLLKAPTFEPLQHAPRDDPTNHGTTKRNARVA